MAAEDEEAANAIQENDNIIDDPDYLPGKATIRLTSASSTPNTSMITHASISSTSSSSVPPPPLFTDETKQLREQLQKQKDLAECFGFKVHFNFFFFFLNKTINSFYISGRR